MSKTPQSASLKRQAKLLQAGAQVAASINTILDPQTLFNQAVDIICDEFDFYYAGVFLLDEEEQYAVLKAGRGEKGKAQIAKKHKLIVGGNSMIGKCTGDGQARIALDVGEEAVHFNNPDLPRTRSEMALPLSISGKVLGALTVQSEEEAAFTQEDILALQTMADQLAIAIENARLHQENKILLRQAERRARLFEAANAVGHRLATLTDLNDLLPKTVDVICEAYGFYYAGVFLLDDTKQWAVLRAGYGEAGDKMMEANHRLEVGGNSMIGAATALAEARIALDVGSEAVHFKNPHLPHTRSEMALPLVVDGNVLGAVTVQSVEEAAFSRDDITTLQTMADHLAIAIHNAYLLQELDIAHRNLVRAKTYEALSTATMEAIHWIGNKAFPMTTALERMKEDVFDEPIDKESLAEDLDMVADSAKLIVEVKEALIGAAREQELRPVLVRDVVQAAAFHAGIPDDLLTIDASPNTPHAITDSTQLARAVGSLLQNASESHPTHITATITPALDGRYVAISIADDGDGIPQELQEKIWTPFFTTKGLDAHGLGLPATQLILTQLGGRITMETTEGHGTTITLVIPAATDDEVVDLSHAPDTILFIDEEDDPWALFAANVLKLAGKNVIVQAQPDPLPNADLILVDEALTTMPVADVLTALKNADAAEKTVVVTAATQVDRATTYFQQGIKDVALKPYTYLQLAAFLNTQKDKRSENAGQASE